VTLGAVIAEQLRAWGFDDLPLERELFGSVDPENIARSVAAHCRTLLGAEIDHYEFFDSSSGSVHGVTLTDGRRVVVKGHRRTVTRDYLEVVMRLQHDLAANAFPAPRPLAGPAPSGTGHVTVEAMLDRDRRADGHDPVVRAALAHGFAEFVLRARPYREAFAAVAHPLQIAEGEVYPPPHSARFDFASSTAGAEWIDALAHRARASMHSIPDGELVVGHGDWRIENVCVVGESLRAVYDWDSVHVEREPVLIASAVTTFSVDWQRAAGERFPSPREMDHFVRDYEATRRLPFTDAERRLLAASMVASLAYGARCEHADRGEPPDGDDCQRALLQRLGRALLDTGLDALDHS
jgi:Ser/Thr protein kinase RdoA (MazF antagonist)